MNANPFLALLNAANRVGELQARIRLSSETLAAGPLRDAAEEAADLIDKADQRLSRAFAEHAPRPGSPSRKRPAA